MDKVYKVVLENGTVYSVTARNIWSLIRECEREGEQIAYAKSSLEVMLVWLGAHRYEHASYCDYLARRADSKAHAYSLCNLPRELWLAKRVWRDSLLLDMRIRREILNDRERM